MNFIALKRQDIAKNWQKMAINKSLNGNKKATKGQLKSNQKAAKMTF